LIQTRDLAYRYPGGTPIHFPDTDVPQGGVLLLSGPSGCGKSTWLALVAGLVKPAAGTLTVAGQALAQLNGVAADAWRARTIGFLPQKLHLSIALTVAQNLAMAQWAAGQAEDPARIAATLAALGVADLAQRKPAQLSGGQAQRVALARAVLLQPRVILADEPTASLDDEAAASAVALLVQTASEQGATLVIATHDGRVAPLIPAGDTGSCGYTALKLSRQALRAFP
jgi:putative ABC transport system ATP-binding protein